MQGKLPDEYIKSIRGEDFDKKLKEHQIVTEELPKIKSFFENIKEKFYKIEWRKWLKRISFAVAVVAIFGIFAGLWNWYSSGNNASLEPFPTLAKTGVYCGVLLDGEGHVSGDVKTLKHNSKLSQPVVKQLADISRASAQMNIRNQVSVIRKLRRNTFFLSVNDGNLPFIGRCLGVCGPYAIVVQHFWEAWINTCKRVGSNEIIFANSLDTNLSCIKLNINDIEHIPVDGISSLCVLKLPKMIPLFCDIRNLIANSTHHKNLNLKASMYEMILEKDHVLPNFYNLSIEHFQNLPVKGRNLWKAFNMHDGYKYEGFSGPGRCGSILLGEGLESPIIGMHIAGYDGTEVGFSELLVRSMFDLLPNSPTQIIADAQGRASDFFVDTEVIGYGRVHQALAHRERGKSRIVPSKLQYYDKGENFKVYTAPAVLSKSDPRIKDTPFSPMVEGCKHHGFPLKQFNKLDFQIVKEDVKNLILAKCKPQRQKVGIVSQDIAINGIDGKEGYEHINFNTSEGFPFVSLRPKNVTNKRWLFNFNEENKAESVHEILQETLDLKWQQRQQNIIPFTVFTDCLKDTTIENEKVLNVGKTRIFSMSPVDFTIQQRMCTLDFTAAYMYNRFQLEHMIGCNPDSYEWTELASRLLTGERQAIMTGDYSKYGDSIPFEFIEAAFEIIIDWYKFNKCEDTQLYQQLSIMPYEVGHAIHLMFDHLYQSVCGQPSGNPLTVIINSIANSFYIRLAWLSIMRFTEYNSLNDFHKFVTMFSYGDDLIVSLADNIKFLFNAKSLSTFFESYGLKFTNANKSNEIIPFSSLEESEFLKRSFRPHPTRKFPQIILAPLKIESIEDTPNWIWSESFNRSDCDCVAFHEMSLQVCNDSIRNAFGRGPEYYDNWTNKLKNFWLKRNTKLNYDTWQQMDAKIFNLHLNLSPYYGKLSYDASK